MTQYSHLHPSVTPILEMTDDERTLWIGRPRWIGYSRAQELLSKLEDLLRTPRQVRMPNMLLIGDSNNGKTSLVSAFLKRHPVDENVSGDHIIAKVMFIQAPPAPSEDGLYAEILSTLFKKLPTSSIAARRKRAIDVMREVELKVLIIDELHNLLAGTSVKQQHFLNVIKYLGNELQISIVGCGTSDLLRAVSIDPQIQNRFTPHLIPKWKADKDYRTLLKSFETVLPLKQASDLHAPEMAKKLLAMSEGTIGELSTLLNAAAIYAINEGVEQITQDVLNSCGYISPSDRTKYASRL